MRNIVSFSGGRTSAYLCHLMIKKFGKENVDFIFMDTGAEHPKTYEFIRKCVEYLDIELTCLQGDFEQEVGKGHAYKVVPLESLKHDMVNGPFARMMNKYGVPNISSAWCTNRMKEETFDKYCSHRFGKGNYITWLGIRADEQKRLRIGKNPRLRYMAEISDFDKEDVLDFWDSMPFNLEIDEHLGNCVFCFKKSINKVALAARDEPELAEKWMQSIDAANNRLNQNITKEVGGLFPYSYEQEIKKGVIYRGHNTLQSIIAKFDLHSRDDIYSTIRSMKRKESGGCTESCEAFGQLDFLESSG
jgi:hypothetical protein